MSTQMHVLFVCTGNICRSPVAEECFRRFVCKNAPHLDIAIESAGLENYHTGQTPDARTSACAAKRGYDLSALRARQIRDSDFQTFDLILAMDSGHYHMLKSMAPSHSGIRMLSDFSPRLWRDVPDPYYGPAQAHEQVLDLIAETLPALLKEVLRLEQRTAKPKHDPEKEPPPRKSNNA